MTTDYLRGERISKPEAVLVKLIGIAIMLILTREVLGGLLRYTLDQSGLIPTFSEADSRWGFPSPT